MLRNLPPGNYRLVVSAQGMRTFTQPGITLNVGQNADVKVQLEVSGTLETVTIADTAPLLQTQDASTGQIVNQKFINDLPLTSRSVFNLAQLSPGVTQAAGGSFWPERGCRELHFEWRPQLDGGHRNGWREPDQPGKQ